MAQVYGGPSIVLEIEAKGTATFAAGAAEGNQENRQRTNVVNTIDRVKCFLVH